MECDICMEDYDQGEHVPKMVPCGHTVCLKCLQKSDKRECPTCRRAFKPAPKALPNNYNLLRLMCQCDNNLTPVMMWCSECGAAATIECKHGEHDILPVTKALRRHLQGVLPRASDQLEDLPDKCTSEQAVQAMTMLAGKSWEVTLKGDKCSLKGMVWNRDKDPLIEAVWLALSTKAVFAGVPNVEWMRELDVNDLCLHKPNEKPVEKATALREAQGIFRISGLKCDDDPAWSLKLLQVAAPTLQELQVCVRFQAHLQVIHSMPLLKRMFMMSDMSREPALASPQFSLPPLPPGHGGGLQWLTVMTPSSWVLRAMLLANAGSLEVLQLTVGTPGKLPWPLSCSDLPAVLGGCGLRVLKTVVLGRDMQGLISHAPAACKKQCNAVRRALPVTVEVFCDLCDGVEYDCFHEEKKPNPELMVGKIWKEELYN
ncbi:uncharacterized protein LOC113206912 [Frankliniella occidentalis]|uniref:Uncharacterized protein LOC113206912 n=1 Tax=Frankliniella occidentalis TaxID=133901 RepID=A0A9C6WXA7_FRAOC|nr:uncharacterized protein LOC113206912 [Frankliniella occidentalis]